jgi:hypothetical protein
VEHEATALQASVERYANSPQSGCCFLTEQEQWKAAPHHSQRAHRRRLWKQANLMSRLVVGNVLDHLNAVNRLLGAETISLYSHMTLVRVACEGAARIGHLLDPETGFEVRILRAAAFRLDSAEANVNAARGLPADSPAMPHAFTVATQKREDVVNQIERAGITIRLNTKGQPTHLELDGTPHVVPRKLNLTHLMEKQFVERPSWYRITSGVVHSAPWMLNDAVASSPTTPELVLKPDILGIGASALAAVDACVVIAGAYARYYGHDPQPAARASMLRARAVDMVMNEWFAEQAMR